MASTFCILDHVSFSYPGSLGPVFSDISCTIGSGWTGIVGANGAGKSTLAGLILGRIKPESGTVRAPAARVACPQTTEEAPDELFSLLADPGEGAYRLIDALGVQYDWPYRWESLSFGERRRAQLAGLLYRAPDLLVLDEPTNHLDIAALEVLGRSLALYSGIGVLISHDRTLLDRLCSQTLFVADGQVAARPGGVSAGLAQAERERSGLLRERRAAQAEVERVRRERSSRRALAASQQSRRSKRGLAPKDHDGRARRDLARVSGRDGVGGKLLRQMDGRLAQAEERLAALDVRGEQKSGVTLYGAPAEKDLLLRYGPGRVPLGQERSLDVPLLEMKPADRIALTGPNGSGKSTLLRALLSSAPALPATVMPQELGAADIARLLAKLGALSNDERGRLLSTVSRLGSDPERLISAAALSPGEARKLLLAFGMAEEVPLIVLDEPTNHMDLPSVIALTAALRDYRGGLLVATHDRVLAAELTSTAWRIGPGRSAAELALTAGPAE